MKVHPFREHGFSSLLILGHSLGELRPPLVQWTFESLQLIKFGNFIEVGEWRYPPKLSSLFTVKA